jgi:hypothetical protein
MYCMPNMAVFVVVSTLSLRVGMADSNRARARRFVAGSVEGRD